ncbi:MAG TPA: hypothetical protein VKA26_06965 [Ignavibacteriaceae bacterium]|nr:hypothetical protein [Ignavibacteriaceae bacterium]
MKKLIYSIPIILLISFSSCSKENETTTNKELENKMNKIAENYTKLVLRVGQFDPDYIDAYYGPAEWRPTVSEKDSITELNQLDIETDSLLSNMESLGNYEVDEMQTLRFKFLSKQLLSVKAKIFMLKGGEFTFDEESKALYDAVAPTHNSEYFRNIINDLNKKLPGKGNILNRFNDFRNRFVIPKEKLDTVFSAAINECRKITRQHIQLPENENFHVEYVTDKAWSGYNWYKGDSYSLIQVNTDLPIYIDRAIDLAAHEGYPGHHVLNTLLDQNLFRRRGWVEFSVYPLFSPQSLIAEGTANYGIQVVLPGEERIKFEKEILFPLAGLDSSEADEYYEILRLIDKLSYAGNEAARNYLDGKFNNEEAIEWLMKYSLMTRERAEQRLKFIEKYRSYVINYNLGQDIVKEYILSNGGIKDNPQLRWELFAKIISTPQTPSGLDVTN